MIARHLPVKRLHTRCGNCGARAPVAEERGWTRCSWCDLRWRAPMGDGVAQAIAGGPVGPTWRGSCRTMRIAGTTEELWLRGDWRDQHADFGGEGGFDPLATYPAKTVSLVMLARDAEDVTAAPNEFHETVAVIDAQEGGATARDGISFVHRPLDGDFAAQRNAGNRAATGEWVFHLDTDERVDADFCAALPHLAGAASASGYAAVGFPRRNIVDGRLSDLFPDVQFRLMRRDMTFEGQVHERPAACATPDRVIVSQHGVIDHSLSAERVAERSAAYDRLGQEPQRHADDDALSRDFVP